MKRLFAVIITIIFTYICCFGLNTAIERTAVSNNIVFRSKNTVVIDAGHGGRDAGAIGFDGSNEKDINLNITLALYDYLMVSGINVILTRDGDYETYYDSDDRSRSDLYNRMDLVNATENSVLISIHQNHFDDPKEWGTQIWYSANTELSKTLADNILNNIKYNLQPNNERINKVSDSSYYLLYKAQVPSIMVECGFTSNEEENAKLQDTEYQKDIAFSILSGICNEV